MTTTDAGTDVHDLAFAYDLASQITGSGYKFRILSVRRKGIRWNLIDLIDRTLHYWYELDLSEPEKLNLDQIREEILGLILTRPGWIADYETPESIKAKFDAARTVKELINTVSVYP